MDTLAQTRLADGDLLACPSCTRQALRLSVGGETVECASCGTTFPVQNGVPDFRYIEERYRSDEFRIDDEFDPNHPSIVIEKIGFKDVMAQRLARRVQRLRRELGEIRLLDIGMYMAGGGGLKPFLKHIEPDIDLYVGIEASDYEMLNGSGRPDKIKIFRGYGEYLPVRDGLFNVVVSIATFDHLFDPDRCLEEIKRVSAPGALLYIQLNNDGSWFKRLLKASAERHREQARYAHNNFWTPSQFRRLLADHGFEITESLGYRYNPILDNPRFYTKIPNGIQTVMTRIADTMGNGLVPDLGGNFAITCRAPA